MSDIELMRQQYLKYLYTQGIPKPYLKTSLTAYGKLGNELAAILNEPNQLAQFKKDFNVINLVGNHKADDVLYALCRGLMLLGSHGFVGNLPWLFDTHPEDFEEFSGIKVLGITGFYDPEYPQLPFDDKSRFTVERFIKEYLKNGGMLVISSGAALSSLQQWYSQGFVRLLMESGKDFIYDPRH